MLDQFHGIIQAVNLLNGTSGTPQERLFRGFTAFYRATIRSEDWPAHLWDKYNGICGLVLACGTLRKTTESMDPTTASECARRVAREMTELAAAVELTRTQRKIPPPVVAPIPGQDSSAAPAGCATGK